VEKETGQQLNVEKSKLIEFTNLVNECCSVMEDSYVADWLNKPNPDLNMEVPIDIFREEGMERILRLLYFIEIGEADV
jgi:hypothetical protein